MEFLENLDPVLKTYWYIAIISSIVFIIQTIFTFIGSDATDGIEADFDGDFNGSDQPFQLFSFRNLINFLLGFSWTGISCYTLVSNQYLLMFISFLIGVVFVYLFYFLIKKIQNFSEDNTFQIRDSIGLSAEVYLNIPAEKSGKGKVLISIKGSFRELEAITPFEQLPTGKIVLVTDVDNNILVVKSI